MFDHIRVTGGEAVVTWSLFKPWLEFTDDAPNWSKQLPISLAFTICAKNHQTMW